MLSMLVGDGKWHLACEKKNLLQQSPRFHIAICRDQTRLMVTVENKTKADHMPKALHFDSAVWLSGFRCH